MRHDDNSAGSSGRSGMRQSAFAAIRWTAVGSLLRAIIAFGQLVVLSRLIPPGEYGAVALIIALVTMAAGISDAGLSSALIRFREVTQRERSSLYWLNLGIGCLMTAGSVALSHPIAVFYDIPVLHDLILIVSITFVLNAAGLQLRVLSERDLQFSRLILAEVLSSVVGAGVSISLAMQQWGSYSIAIGQMVSALLLLILTWSLLAGRWRPSFVFSIRDVSRFLSFGMDMFLVNLVTSVTVQADMLIAGRLIPSQLIAFFSQPRDLCSRIMQTVNPIITRVGLPLMARHQSNPLLVGELYLKTVRMSSSILFPVFALISLLSTQIVEIALGQNWGPSADVLPFVAIWFLVRSVINTVGSLLTALGRSRLALYYQCLVLAFVVTGSSIGASYGFEYVPLVLIYVYIALIECVWLFLLKPLCHIGFFQYHEQLVRPMICTILAASSGYIACHFVSGNITQILFGGSVGVIIYILSASVLNKEWIHDMIDFMKISKKIKRLA